MKTLTLRRTSLDREFSLIVKVNTKITLVIAECLVNHNVYMQVLLFSTDLAHCNTKLFKERQRNCPVAVLPQNMKAGTLGMG